MSLLRSRFLSCALFALVPACGNAELGDTPTPADSSEVAPTREIINWCLRDSANATLNLGAGENQVSSTSPNTSYSSSSCGAYIVDITAGAGAAQPPEYYLPSFNVGGGVANQWFASSQAQCSSFAGYEAVYKQPAGTSGMTFVGGGSLVGTWVPPGLFQGYCQATPAAGFVAIPTFSPPASGTDTYRVVTSARLGSTVQLVNAGAFHILDPG